MLRDMVVFAIFAVGLPISFRKPFFGLMLFSWLAYMRPQDLCWGPARDFRFSFYTALALYAGYGIFEFRRGLGRKDLRNYFLVGLFIFVGISIPYGETQFERQYERYIELGKILLMASLTTTLVDTEKRMRLIVWTIAVSLGFYGVKGGIFGAQGGRIIEGPGGLILDNNDFGLAMVMNLPLLFYLSKETNRPRVRMALLFACLLTVITIVVTKSRGAFLATTAVFAITVWKSEKRAMGFGLGFLAAIVFVIFMPEDYRARLSTIREGKDESAAARLVAWECAIRMAAANPVTGVGFYNFRSSYWKYNPDPLLVPGKIVTHNSYLQVWSETGSFALLCFLGLLFYSIFRCFRIRALVKGRGDLKWADYYANAFQLSLIGYMIGATFLNRAHFDLFYQIVALTVALDILVRERLQAPEAGAHQHFGAPGHFAVRTGSPFLRPLREAWVGGRALAKAALSWRPGLRQPSWPVESKARPAPEKQVTWPKPANGRQERSDDGGSAKWPTRRRLRFEVRRDEEEGGQRPTAWPVRPTGARR
ncbi:MAG: putative O-glycosylation ligase, exosortase A system-associated [Planctomycetota bacterium]